MKTRQRIEIIAFRRQRTIIAVDDANADSQTAKSPFDDEWLTSTGPTDNEECASSEEAIEVGATAPSPELLQAIEAMIKSDGDFRSVTEPPAPPKTNLRARLRALGFHRRVDD